MKGSRRRDSESECEHWNLSQNRFVVACSVIKSPACWRCATSATTHARSGLPNYKTGVTESATWMTWNGSSMSRSNRPEARGRGLDERLQRNQGDD